MPDLRAEDSALVADSAMDNDQYLRDLVRKFRDARAAGNNRDFARENKTTARRINPFRYMTSKHTNTGRFGARTEDNFDYIDALGAETPKGKYFDPFSLKTIVENAPEESAAISGNDQAIPDMTGGEDVDIDPELENNAIISAFTARVGAQIRLAKENDFEAKRNGEDAIMSLPQAIVEGMPDSENGGRRQYRDQDTVDSELNRMIAKYNAGRPLIPDGSVKEVIPDGFGIQLIVDEPAPEYTQEWRLFEGEQTKGAKAYLKSIFRKITFQKGPSKEELFDRFITTLPEYQILYRKGKELFDLVHANDDPKNRPQYDPSTDPFIKRFKAHTSAVMKAQAYGHAIVRMKATKYGAPASEYSFMFGSTAESGMAGTVTGAVSNPASVHQGAIKGDYKINYSDYLKAAAKIRGTMGSMRTYSIMGYNCTSFAAEVARAANVPLNDDDTSSNVMNFRHHSQRVDSPALLARTLTARNQRLQSLVYSDPATSKENDTTDKTLDEKKQQLFLQFRPMFETNHAEILGKIRRTQLLTDQRITMGIQNLIGDIVNRGAEIDRNLPTTGLTGQALQDAEQRRILGRQLEFEGSSTESEALQNLIDDEAKLLEWIFLGVDKNRLLDHAAPPNHRLDFDRDGDLKEGIKLIKGTRLYEALTKRISNAGKVEQVVGRLAQLINNDQKEKLGELQDLIDLQDDWAGIINGLDEYLEGGSLRSLTKLAYVDLDILRAYLGDAVNDVKQSVQPVSTGIPGSAGDMAERTATDAEKPDVSEELDDVNRTETEPTEAEPVAEPVNAIVPADEDDVVRGKQEATGEETEVRGGMIPAAASADIGRDEITKLVMSIDQEAATRTFKEIISVSVPEFTGNSAKTRKVISRGEMINVLAEMSRDPRVRSVLAQHYSQIVGVPSDDDKEIAFEEMLFDVTMSGSLVRAALTRCGII